MEKKEKNFGWGVLGFFVPLAGLILFFVWLNNKKGASKAAGIGALIGGSICVISTIIAVISIPALFTRTVTSGYYPSTPIEKNQIIEDKKETKEEDNSKTITRSKACTGTSMTGANKYDYKVKLTKKEIDECKTVTVKLNDDFTMKLELFDDDYLLDVYINDNYVTEEFVGDDIIYGGYIVGKTFITREFSTSVGAHPILMNKEGVKYNFTDPVTGSLGDERLVMDDGMTITGVEVNGDGDLLITGIKYSEQRGFYFPGGYDLDYQDMCDIGYDATLQKYNIPEDYPYSVVYKYSINDKGEFEMNYKDKTVTESFKEYYNNRACKAN